MARLLCVQVYALPIPSPVALGVLVLTTRFGWRMGLAGAILWYLWKVRPASQWAPHQTTDCLASWAITT